MTLYCLGSDEVQPKPNTGVNLNMQQVTTLYWDKNKVQYRDYVGLGDFLTTNKGTP
jgi:hypothetical protein